MEEKKTNIPDNKVTKNTELAQDMDFISNEISMSPEDKKEIMAEIDSLTRSKSTASLAEKLTPPTQKQGLVVPITVGVLLFSIAITLVLVTQILQGAEQERSIIASANSFQTTESQLIQEITDRAREELETKENEVLAIQEELAAMQSTYSDLQTGIDRNIDIRRGDLEANLAAELEAERQRLLALGIEATELELEKFRQERLANIEETIAQYRNELEAELNSQQSGIQNRINQLASNLENKQNEQRQLTLELAQSRQELETLIEENVAIADLQAQLENASRSATEYEEQYQNLIDQQRGAELVLDQIREQYSAAFLSISQNNYDQGAIALNSLDNLLDNVEPTNQMITKRITIDNEVVSTLRDYINLKIRDAAQAAQLAEQSKALTAALNQSQESISQEELQEQKILSQNLALNELQISLDQRNNTITALQKELDDTKSSLVRARTLLERGGSTRDTNENETLNRINQMYADGVIQVNNLLNRGNRSAQLEARTIFISTINRMGIFDNFQTIMNRLDRAIVQEAQSTSGESARRDFNDDLATVIRYIGGQSNLQSTVQRLYANDRALETNANRIANVIDNSIEQALAREVMQQQEQLAEKATIFEEVVLGYVTQVIGNSEVTLESLNTSPGYIGATVGIYRLKGTKRQLISIGVISRREDTKLTAQINNTTPIQKNDVVYLQY